MSEVILINKVNHVITYIREILPDAFLQKEWIMMLGSFMVALISRYFFKWKKCGWGNKIVGNCLVLDVVWLLIIAVLKLPLWNIVWVIVPWVYFVVRYIHIKNKRSETLKYTGDERAKKELEYLDWLLHYKLMCWEINAFLFDALGVLFRIGAIRQLKEELKKLDDFKNHYKYKRLLSYVYSVSHKPQEMITLLKDVIKEGNLSQSERIRTLNNLYYAYTVADDKEGRDSTFRMLEDEFNLNVNHSFCVEVVEALLCRYEQEGDKSKDKLDNLIHLIKNIKVKDFDGYIRVTDILFLYYRRNNKREEAIAFLDELGEKARSLNLKEESLLIVLLRLVRQYIDFNYRWKEITIDLFRSAEFWVCNVWGG
jgi:hypothetical protein